MLLLECHHNSANALHWVIGCSCSAGSNVDNPKVVVLGEKEEDRAQRSVGEACGRLATLSKMAAAEELSPGKVLDLEIAQLEAELQLGDAVSGSTAGTARRELAPCNSLSHFQLPLELESMVPSASPSGVNVAAGVATAAPEAKRTMGASSEDEEKLLELPEFSACDLAFLQEPLGESEELTFFNNAVAQSKKIEDTNTAATREPPVAAAESAALADALSSPTPMTHPPDAAEVENPSEEPKMSLPSSLVQVLYKTISSQHQELNQLSKVRAAVASAGRSRKTFDRTPRSQLVPIGFWNALLIYLSHCVATCRLWERKSAR